MGVGVGVGVQNIEEHGTFFFPLENETLWKLIATLNHWTPNKLARERILFTGTLSHKCLLCF